MRVAILSPYSLNRPAGNSVTIARIFSSLIAADCTVKVFAVDRFTPDELLKEISDFSPDIIHGFHAFRTGYQARQAAITVSVPYVITMTGTDIYCQDSYSSPQKQLLEAASAVTVFSETAIDRLSGVVPFSRVTVIPQGVSIKSEPENRAESGEFVFLLPAGIRPVKNLLFPLRPLARLAQSFPKVRLKLVGEPIDADYAEKVIAEYEASPVADWIGAVSHDRMPEIYNEASVVLNCSLSEGGMANSLLEGMQLGIPVIASDVEGNRSLVKDGYNGLIYSDVESFLNAAGRLIVYAGLRSELVKNAREYLAKNCSPELEAHRYIELYRLVTGK